MEIFVIWIAQKKNIQFSASAAPDKISGRTGFILKNSFIPSFFTEYAIINGKAKSTLKNTNTGEGRAHQIEKRGIEPHINVDKNISSKPLCFCLILQPPCVQDLENVSKPIDNVNVIDVCFCRNFFIVDKLYNGL